MSRSVVSDSLRPHESQHARPPCPSPTPGVHSDTRPSSQWYHPAISSSVVPFFSCPQSLPASQSFPMSQLFTWGGQITGVLALASFLPKKSQGWSWYSIIKVSALIPHAKLPDVLCLCIWMVRSCPPPKLATKKISSSPLRLSLAAVPNNYYLCLWNFFQFLKPSIHFNLNFSVCTIDVYSPLPFCHTLPNHCNVL